MPCILVNRNFACKGTETFECRIIMCRFFYQKQPENFTRAIMWHMSH